MNINIKSVFARTFALIALFVIPIVNMVSAQSFAKLSVVGKPATVFIAYLEGHEPKPIPAIAPISNSNTRVTVAANGSLMTAFVVSPGSKDAVRFVRAVGPGLKMFGVEGYMPHPVIDVYKDGKLWQSSADWSRVYSEYLRFREVEKMAGAYPLEAGSNDAIITLTLGPGTYTVLIRPYTDGMTEPQGGDVLLEMYDLPELSVPNSPPTNPVAMGESTAIASRPWVLSLVSNDRDLEPIQFGFDWDDDGRIDEYSEMAPQGIPFIVNRKWVGLGEKTFGVIARDGHGNLSQLIRFSVMVTGETR